MCGITGWMDWKRNVMNTPEILEQMTESLINRGPDASGTWFSGHCALGHRRLSIIDPENGAQPMYRKYGGHTFAIVYNGELYNTQELRRELEIRGHIFKTHCDTEVVLVSYIEWGRAAVERFNGIFALAIWNGREESLYLCRDRVGVKPLFYAHIAGIFMFGSEPKAILAHPDFPAKVGAEGLAEIFAIGPARTPGHGIYRNMAELKPGCYLIVDRNGIRNECYWKLQAREHEHDLDKTAAIVRDLLRDAAERQLVSDVPVCTLLSGGLDSSALTTFAAQHYQTHKLGALQTFSIDYVGNDTYFQSTAFTPQADRPWIELMTEKLGTTHHYIELDIPELIDALDSVVDARDLPGMADVDASLLLFCQKIKQKATVAISGEAADEIFAGYPWFYRDEAIHANTFPWALHTPFRASFLKTELEEWIRPQQYVADRYAEALQEVPHLSGEKDDHARRMRELSYLNMTRFMPTLLDRKDRMSMASGLEVRVPFCDHRLIEYAYNIKWEIKTADQREKGILRRALQGVLPESILTRKKSPYPKTHHPDYLRLIAQRFEHIMDDPASPIRSLIDANKIRTWLRSQPEQQSTPWFGQLMTGPQWIAYLIQVNTWMRKYKIQIV
jgi:asparagine synthase (glutamine-hydrolysing)